MCHDGDMLQGDQDTETVSTFSELVPKEIQISTATRAWLTDLERQGWRPRSFHNMRGLRYWCPCERQHNAWVSTTDAPRSLITKDRNMLVDRSCYKFDKTEED